MKMRPMGGQMILVVDDDSGLRELVGSFLAEHGYVVREAGDARAMRAALAGQRPDLIVLDLMMPGEDGLSALRTMGESRPPVIILSAMGGDADRIVGLELGADDYMTKPCNPRELLARVRAVLRRSANANTQGETYRFSGWRMDVASRELTAPDGTLVTLTPREWGILAELVKANRRVLSRDELISRVASDDADSFDRAIDIAVSRLRRKLADHDPAEVIRTVRGEGYGLAPDVTHAAA